MANGRNSEQTRAGVWLQKSSPIVRPILTVLVIVLALPVLALVILPLVLGWLAPPLDLSKDLYVINRPVALTFLDSDGNVVGHRGAVVGDRLKLDEMPGYLPKAFIAMEDRSYYQNNGFDLRGLVRAAYVNLRAGHVVAGGSTITQQTAKIVFLSPKRTFGRKFEELIDAAELAKSLNKDQILDLYLNRVYLGSGAYGVDAAAHTYFNRSARDLTLSQAAMLATLTRAPSFFSPRRDLAAAQARANRVLEAMVETGAITQEQAEDARAHPAVVSDRSVVDSRNYFLDTAGDVALKLAAAQSGSQSSDLVVHTTLEPKVEEVARVAAVRAIKKRGKKEHASEAAVVVMKPGGAVVALVGGVDYDESVYNRATQAHRQPGSAFKPFVYLAALEAGLQPTDLRDDQPVNIKGWEPTNYGGRSYGTITLADALAHSVNTVTANLAQEVGISTVIDAAERCGIRSPLQANASLALGTSEVTPLELTAAYAAFASGGNRVYPYLVTEVDSGGHPLFQRKPEEAQRIIASHVNRDLVGMLYGVITSGTGRSAALAGHQAAGKTGTTQDYHDAWFVGFTTDYVTAVWVGNDDSSPMRGVTGGGLPASIWHSVMTPIEAGLPSTPLDMSVPEETGETGLFAEMPETPSAVDDESGQPPREGSPQPAQNENHGFWDWLFGHNSSEGERRGKETPNEQGDDQGDRSDEGDRSDAPPDAPYVQGDGRGNDNGNNPQNDDNNNGGDGNNAD